MRALSTLAIQYSGADEMDLQIDGLPQVCDPFQGLYQWVFVKSLPVEIDVAEWQKSHIWIDKVDSTDITAINYCVYPITVWGDTPKKFSNKSH